MTDEQIKIEAEKLYPPPYRGPFYDYKANFYSKEGYIVGHHSRNEEIKQLKDVLEQLNTLEKVTNLSDGEIVGIVNKALNNKL